MKRVAVFGNAGGGKSILSQQLAAITNLPLYTLDIIQFRDGRYWPQEKDGGRLSHDAYLKLHASIIEREQWIIDGYGCVASAWERFAAADTLVYVDLPPPVHFWGVAKRLAAGLFRGPPGWPAESPVWESSLDSFRVVWLCHRRLTPKYRDLVATSVKRVHHLSSRAEMRAFLRAVQDEQRSRSG